MPKETSTQVKFLTLDGLKRFKEKLLAKISLDFQNLDNKFFNKVTGDKISGKIKLTENINYGKNKPINPENGEIFFEEFNGNFPIDISAPSISAKNNIQSPKIIENGVDINTKYALKSEIPTIPDCLPSTGGTLTGNLNISHATESQMGIGTSNPKITFSENGIQKVSLVYNDFDAYRPPRGLKIMADDNTDSTNAWLEVEGDIYSNNKQVPYISTITTSTSVPSGLKKGELYIIVE